MVVMVFNSVNMLNSTNCTLKNGQDYKFYVIYVYNYFLKNEMSQGSSPAFWLSDHRRREQRSWWATSSWSLLLRGGVAMSTSCPIQSDTSVLPVSANCQRVWLGELHGQIVCWCLDKANPTRNNERPGVEMSDHESLKFSSVCGQKHRPLD